ncbi:UDP-N-acetylmuramyl peptide synthase [Cephaloticoccus primus]|uniref:UDP-N-acetylmuramoyl-L-alanyl-D-glutamate--2,6-diaminopimelate ligase n=1 Tax=Cephaloticoccus primus TaxID=1548207 RepID=A0A139SLY7_9BACT|nr:UDP-N-acetylmuramoyl-L-alanyl-D-glutamate--2,6-diaminopimelate ligase [Cephaloticoccus primus]KXU35494.1 UDP-N-acetylmuramyl peptide synthase [Cephaloticoccus primus]
MTKPVPKLSDFITPAEIQAHKGSLDCPISGLVMDSRRVVPGSVFFALPGRRSDGAQFIDEAISRGAVAIVAQKLPALVPSKLTFVQVAEPRVVLARAAQRYYQFPDRALSVIGVTGTNGKTTVTHLVKHLLGTPEQPVGLFGTIRYDLGARTVPSFRTTPESLDIYGMMAQMRGAGCKQVAMEVSSHGIDQYRVLGLGFEVAVFTNLTRDHLDYHSGLEEYFQVKARLFTGETGAAPKIAVINIDDPYGARLAAMLPEGVRLVTYGESAAAQIRAEAVELNFKDTRLRLLWPEGELELSSPLIGRYNVSNLLAAAAVAWSTGRDLRECLARLADFKGVPGRMEQIDVGQPYSVLVDYAHTDDALSNALGMLRAITPGRLMVVFGCGGQRDRAKRALMTAAVQRYADFAFATADNPRGEPLAQIFKDMESGVSDGSRITWIEDRRRAISLALDACKAGDCLLVAGKGHESYQEFADTVIPFDDRQTVRELIAIKRLKDDAV